VTPTAIVTGASRGIGRALAAELAAAGWRLALMARDRSALEEVAAEAVASGAPAPHVEAFDITDADALAGAAERALAHLDGRVDLLANNAGAAARRKRLEDLTDDDWAYDLDLNLMAPIRLARHCFAALAEAKGLVVNVSSIVAGRASPTGGPYAAAKAGLESFTRTLALEWARHGVRAVTIAPGYVDTDFNAESVASGYAERFLKGVPTRTPIEPGEIARVIVGLTDHPSITGTVVTVDGGRSINV
jgi:NAD(P)-dependent dehydrogenase (short-subunit alcohol dehydrogenase family)